MQNGANPCRFWGLKMVWWHSWVLIPDDGLPDGIEDVKILRCNEMLSP